MGDPIIDKSRHSEVLEMYINGSTYQEIADFFGVTRQYIGNIASKNGVTKKDGGKTKKTENKNSALGAKKDKVYLSRYGLTFFQYKEIAKTIEKFALIGFKSQKGNARRRGIDWKFSFLEWRKVWEDSGLWDSRGRGSQGCCMARIGDCGGYELGNVEIVTNRKNIQDVRRREAEEKTKNLAELCKLGEK